MLNSFITSFMRPNPILIRNENVELEGIGVSNLKLEFIENELESKMTERKLKCLVDLLENIEFNQCFIFTHNHSIAQRTSIFLNSKRFLNTLLSGRLQQHSRTQVTPKGTTKKGFHILVKN